MFSDLFSKLRPLLGSKADALQIAYAAGDAQTKKHIETLLTVVACKVGFGIKPPAGKVAQGKYTIGQVVVSGVSTHPIGLDDADLFHVGVFGQTGRGKTNAVLVLLQQLSERGVPFLVFDWKRTGYRDIADDVQVFTVGRDISPFYFNPLIPPPGVAYTIWYKQFIQCLSHAYFLGHGCEMILQDVLHPKRTPTLRHLLKKLQAYPAKWRKLYWLQSTERAIKALCYGGIDKVFNSTHNTPLDQILNQNVIFELDALSDSEAKFFVEILLSAIYIYRKEKRHTGLKHACVIEEAHHILSREDKAKEQKSVMDKLFREIREYGEALIVVDQMPSSLLASAIANLSTQISFSLSLDADVRRMSDSMLLSQSERHWLGRLPVGVALMKRQNRWHAPFFVKIPLLQIRRGTVSDEAIAKIMPTLFAKKSLKLPPQTKTEVISLVSQKDNKTELNDERGFLKDVKKHPHSTMTQRYQRLGLNPRRGVKIKDQLLKQQLIKEVIIKTANGIIKLLQLTEKPHHIGNPSIQHTYWVEKIKQTLQNKGYRVFVEFPLKTGGAVDVLAVKEKLAIAVEVETGKSDILANLNKCVNAGIFSLIFAATTKQAKDKIEKQLRKTKLQNHPCIRIVEARYFDRLAGT